VKTREQIGRAASVLAPQQDADLWERCKAKAKKQGISPAERAVIAAAQRWRQDWWGSLDATWETANKLVSALRRLDRERRADRPAKGRKT